MFGKSIEDILERERRSIPYIITSIVDFLERKNGAEWLLSLSTSSSNCCSQRFPWKAYSASRAQRPKLKHYIKPLTLVGVFVYSLVCVLHALAAGEAVDLDACCSDEFAAAALIKMFLRELPESLIPKEQYGAFMQALSAQGTNCTLSVALFKVPTRQGSYDSRAGSPGGSTSCC